MRFNLPLLGLTLFLGASCGKSSNLVEKTNVATKSLLQSTELENLPSQGMNLTAGVAMKYSVPKVSRNIYVAKSGNDSSSGSSSAPFKTVQKALDQASPGTQVIIRSGTYYEFLSLENKGSSSAPIVIRGEGNAVVKDPYNSSWSWDWNGVLNVIGSKNVVISNLKIEDSHWAGVYVEGSNGVVVQNVKTLRTGSSGIYVRESENITIRGNDVQRACYQTLTSSPNRSQESISLASVKNFIVTRNEVSRSGTNWQESTGGEGIDAKEAVQNGKITENRVFNLNRVGIYVDAWNASASNIEVSRNHVFNTRQGVAISAEDGGTLSDVKVIANLIYDNEESGIVVSAWDKDGPRKNISIQNNTIVRNGKTIYGGGIDVQSQNISGFISIRNNILSQNEKFQIKISSGTSADVSHNLIDGFRSLAGEVKGSASVLSNPKFVNAGANDFRLRSDSKAIDSGNGAGLISYQDVDLFPRNLGTAIDLGAHEYLGSSWKLNNLQTGGTMRPKGCEDTSDETLSIVQTPGYYSGSCVRWKMIPTSDGYFYLKSAATGHFMRSENCAKATGSDEVSMKQVPSTKKGNCTQWKGVPTEGNSVRLVNRDSANYIRPTGCSKATDESIPVSQVASRFSGQCTMWTFRK